MQVFVREAVQRFSALRPLIIGRLLGAVGAIRCGPVQCHALWILGEYATTPAEVRAQGFVG